MPSNNQNHSDDHSLKLALRSPVAVKLIVIKKHVKRKNSATQKLVLSAGDVSFGHY